jgi:LemA protein
VFIGFNIYFMTGITWFIIILAALIVLYFIFAYNNFVKLGNRTKEALSDIEVQEKRRFDLIPNLVSAVKGYVTHEAGTLEKVTEARTKLMQAGSLNEKAQADDVLTGALKSLFAVAESYPDLKANQNFIELQRELSDTENKIQAARRFYNANVRDLNIAVEMFPANIIAKMFSFGKMDLFDLPDDSLQKQPVEVKF